MTNFKSNSPESDNCELKQIGGQDSVEPEVPNATREQGGGVEPDEDWPTTEEETAYAELNKRIYKRFEGWPDNDQADIEAVTSFVLEIGAYVGQTGETPNGHRLLHALQRAAALCPEEMKGLGQECLCHALDHGLTREKDMAFSFERHFPLAGGRAPEQSKPLWLPEKLDLDALQVFTEAIGRMQDPEVERLVLAAFPPAGGGMRHYGYCSATNDSFQQGNIQDRLRAEPTHGFGLVINVPKERPEDWGALPDHHYSGDMAARVKTWGASGAHISHATCVWFECDAPAFTKEEQRELPARTGILEPSVIVDTGGKSLHQYLVLAPGERLQPKEWQRVQKALIAEIQRVVPEAGADPSMSSQARVMRAPGWVHPRTKLPTVMIKRDGPRYTAAQLLEMADSLGGGQRQRRRPAGGGGFLPPGAALPPVEPSDLEKARAALACLDPAETDYEVWLQVGMALHSVDDGLLKDWDDWSARDMARYGDETCEQKWASFTEGGGVGLGTLIQWAKDTGRYVAPARREAWLERERTGVTHAEFQAYLEARRTRSYRELLDALLKATEEGDEDQEMGLRADLMSSYRCTPAGIDAALLKTLTARAGGRKKTAMGVALTLQDGEPVDWLLEGYLPEKGQVILSGEAGTGKTFLALSMAMAVIEGRGFLDYTIPAQPGKVLMIATDGGMDSVRSDMGNMGYAEHPALQGPEAHLTFWAYNQERGSVAWDAGVSGLMRLKAEVEKGDTSLVIIDSCKTVMSRAGLDYCDNKQVAVLLTFFKEVICRHTTVAWLNHDGARGSASAGAKAWVENADGHIFLEKVEGPAPLRRPLPDVRSLSVRKQRCGMVRDFQYRIGEHGLLEVVEGTREIGTCRQEIIVLLAKHALKGKPHLHYRFFVDEMALLCFNEKTVKNSLTRELTSKTGQLRRLEKGLYALKSGIDLRAVAASTGRGAASK